MNASSRTLLAAVSLCLGMFACESREPPLQAPPLPPEPQIPLAAPTPEEVVAPVPGLPSRETEPDRARRIQPAFAADDEYARGTPESARRLVYRVTLRVPRSLGVADPSVPSPAAELYVDVSRDRLRARFAGGGWSLPPGAEVRLRRDEPGVYVFHGPDGRPLGPGQLAQWFEGGRTRFEPRYRINTPPSREQSGPGDLLCRLVAEWTNSPPDTLARRCGEGGAPPSMRVGLWRMERTADVAVEVPREALRADHEDPPRPSAQVAHRAFLSPELMARISPRRGPTPEPADDAPGEGLIITNRGRARMIVTVGGTPVGWVDRGATAHFVGLRPGTYQVGAMRPFGLQTAARRPVVVPGRINLPR